MADNFNNIKFKRGTFAALQSLNTAANRSQIEEGCFYLTIEEGTNAPESTRLFIGRNINGTKTVVPVNQGIIQIDDVSDLTHKTQPGDFAYIKNGNILCVNSNGQWVQINQVADNFLDSLSTSIATSNNTATITTTGAMQGGESDRTTSFSIKGGDNITVTSSGTTLTIEGNAQSTLSSDAVASNKTNIELDNGTGGSVEIAGGTNVTLSGAANKISIASKDTHVSSATVAAQAQGYKLTINETENATAKEATFDPLISYISATNNGTDTKTSVHFVNGTAELPIYSREIIDQKLRGVNAVVYQGVIPAGGIFDIEEAAVGDTYMANSAFTLPAANSTTGSTVNVVSGDLLIANGTEDPDTGLLTTPITFDVVPSGNDHDTVYSFENNSSHGVNLHPDQGSNSGTFKLSAGASGLITLTDTWTASSKTKDVAIEHAAVTRTDPTKITETQSDQGSKTITSVKSITTNTTGHVTAVQLQDITVVDTNATVKEMTTSAATASNVATVTTGVELSHSGAASGAAADKKTTTFSLTSDNLAVSNSGTTVKMNYTWGTF